MDTTKPKTNNTHGLLGISTIPNNKKPAFQSPVPANSGRLSNGTSTISFPLRKRGS
jgi:hypothetical protein